MRPVGPFWQFGLLPSGFRCLLLLLACGWPNTALVFAQEQIHPKHQLTLDEAVDLALRQNLDVQIATLNIATAQEQRVVAFSELVPHAGLDATETISRYNLKALLIGVQIPSVGKSKGPYQSVHAAVSQAEASLEDARLQLSYTVLRAPVSGRIGRKSAETGQRVQVGQPVMAIVEDRPWVVANFKETQLAKMREKQVVEIQIDSFPHHKFSGHVDSLAPGSGNEFAVLPPDNATGNFTKIVQRVPVKIILDQESVRGYEGLLSPGMSAVVTVTTR